MAQCTPVRWEQYTGFKNVDGTIKTVDRKNHIIVISTDDIELLCLLSRFGELRYHQSGLIMLAYDNNVSFGNALSFLQNTYPFIEGRKNPLIEYAREVVNDA